MSSELVDAPENSSEYVEELCLKFFEKIGNKDGTLHKEALGKKGDNYAATVRRFVLKYGTTIKPIRFIVKTAPTDETLRKFMKIVEMFKNEALVYDKLLPKYKELEDTARIPKEKKLKSAVCYGIHLVAPHECLALEDLNENGFAIADRLKPLSDEEVELVIKELAKFHALGFVLRERESSLFEEIRSELTDILAQNGNDERFKGVIGFLTTQMDVVLDDDHHKERVKEILSTCGRTTQLLYEIDQTSEYAIVIQGDCWTNNFLFKSEKQSEKPTEVVMLDYQLARITSPTVDLHHLIFNCTDSEARSQNYYKWLDLYYDNFTHYLGCHDLKSSNVYPRDKFDKDLKTYAENALVVAIFSASLHVREGEEVVDFIEEGIDETRIEDEIQKLGVSSMKKATAEKFKEKVRGLVKDFISYEYI